jgi:hypothetical protein
MELGEDNRTSNSEFSEAGTLACVLSVAVMIKIIVDIRGEQR